MIYTLKVPTAMCGNTIPLIKVAEAMARHAASGNGTLPLHGPTLKNARQSKIGLLLHDARRGALTVCNIEGHVLPVADIVGAADLTDVLKNFDSNSRTILALYVRVKHLQDWGDANGDEFHIEDSPVEVIEFDLTNEHGEIIKKGYYRGSVGNLSPVTNDAASLLQVPAASEAAPAQPLQRTAAQEAAILTAIRQTGCDPLTLPKNEPGKPGVKNKIRAALNDNLLFVGKTVFDKAWGRLRQCGGIVDKV